MTEFRVGDLVRKKKGSVDLVVRSAEQQSNLFCISPCGKQIILAASKDLELLATQEPATLSRETISEIAKAVAVELRENMAYQRWLNEAKTKYASMAVKPVSATRPADTQAEPKQPWIPKPGDWVRINKPVNCYPEIGYQWMAQMDKFDGALVKVDRMNKADGAICIEGHNWAFAFSWLAPPVDTPEDFVSTVKCESQGQKTGKPTSEVPSREWLQEMAELETGECISVGGLAVDCGLYKAPAVKRYREPTLEDLKNGPIECEVGDKHEKRTLIYVFENEPGRARFATVDKEMPGCVGRWIDCRIEVTGDS